MKRSLLLAGGTAFSWLAIAPAVAQGAPAAPSDEGAAPIIEEIVVTARKRRESLLEVPIAITAVTEQTLTAKNIASVADLTNTVPNVSFTQGGGDSALFASVIYIRGVGQNDYANSTDPGVGTYVDGVYLGRTIGGAIELPDIAQVEVLRGPQGTLFGKNTIGGAINITSKRPSFTNRGSLQLTYGERDRINFDADGDIRISDTLALHGSVATRRVGGFVERLNGGKPLGRLESYSGRLKAEYRPAENWTVTLSGDYSDQSGSTPRVTTAIDPGNSLAALWNNVPAALIGNIVSGGLVPVDPSLGFETYAQRAGQRIDPAFASPSLRATNAGGDYSYGFKGGGISGRIEGVLSPALTVRSISAYREFSSISNSDQDGQSVFWGQAAYRDRQVQYSQEINLLGDLWDGRVDYIFGGYYFREVAKAFQTIDIATPIIKFQNDYATRTSSYAGFGEFNVKITDALIATAGVRYTNEPKRFNAQTACRPGTVLPVCNPQGFYLPPTQVSATFDSTDPHFALKYLFARDFVVYASFQRGFKSGGFNARANNQAQVLPYNPEHVSSWEIGTKGNFGAGLLTYSLAAFYYDYTDLQVTATGTDASGNSIAFVGNVDAKVRGFEGEFVARPVRNFTIDGSFGYTLSDITDVPQRLTDFFSASGLRPVTTANRIPKTPEFTFNIGAVLKTPIGTASSLDWRIDYARVSSQFSEIQNFVQTQSPAHGNLGFRITYDSPIKGLSLALYGKNMLDESYIENGFYPNGGAGAQIFAVPSRPREIGASLRWDFGN